MKQWRSLPLDYSGRQLHAALRAVVAVCTSTPDREVQHASELRQLSRRGVCRFLGTIAVARAFGVACRAADGEVGFCMGLKRQMYQWVDGEPLVSTLFLERVRTLSQQGATDPLRSYATSLFPPCFDAGAQRAVSDLVAFSGSFKSFLGELGRHVPTLLLKGKGAYVRDSIVRKHVLARQSGATGWEECSIPTLQSLSVDRCAFLECFDASFTAAEVSRIVCGRPHWANFVSMFCCLWSDVAANKPQAEAVLERARRGGQARKTIEDFQAEHGFSPHPHTFVSRLGDADHVD